MGTPAAPRELTSTAQTRGLLMLMLSRVRIAAAAQLATVLTREGAGVGYMRRVCGTWGRSASSTTAVTAGRWSGI
ncbi:hypothetical protein ACWF9B_00100 [Streptomyces sp. NPDC055089]